MNWGPNYGWGYSQRITKKDEKEALEGELDAMQEEMKEIKARLEEIKGE